MSEKTMKKCKKLEQCTRNIRHKRHGFLFFVNFFFKNKNPEDKTILQKINKNSMLRFTALRTNFLEKHRILSLVYNL